MRRGGTSFEATLIQDGRPLLLRQQDVDRRRIALPSLGIHTLGAGGGSIAWIDGGGLLHVGPRSAGSLPGPACYGRGGDEPTATDAALMLGYLHAETFLDGRMPLDRVRAETVIGRLGDTLGLDAIATSRGIVDIVATNMAAGIQAVTVQRGLDPRAFVLVAGGGAGPLFACRIAEELQIPAVMVPATSATLCAWGALYADLASNHTVSLAMRFDAYDAEAAQAALEDLRREGHAVLERNGIPEGARVLQTAADVRYVGQYDDITVPLLESEWDFDDLSELLARFHGAHDALNGYASHEHACELTALHLTARGIVEKPPLAGARHVVSEQQRPARRTIWLEDGARDVPVIDVTRLRLGERVAGPAIVELPGSTLVLRPGFTAGVDRAGNLLAYRADARDFTERLGG